MEDTMITRKDIFEALGAETEDRFLTGMLVGIGVGALIGGAVALLLAPKSGAEMRHIIGEKSGDLIAKAKDRMGHNGGAHDATTTEPMR
jgi:gas vesicle protein